MHESQNFDRNQLAFFSKSTARKCLGFATYLVFHILTFNAHHSMMPDYIVASNNSTTRKIVTNYSPPIHRVGRFIFEWKKYRQLRTSLICQKQLSYIIKVQLSPIFVCPQTWLPGYNWQPFPNLAEGPTVQKGPMETPCIQIRLDQFTIS